MDTLQSATAELASLIDIAAGQLCKLTGTATRVDGHWSPKEILGHLIDSASNNHQRFVRGQLNRELISPNYAQNEWVATERFNDRDWVELVQFWLSYNRHLVHIMSHAAPERLHTMVRVGEDEPVTLEFVMIDYVRHLKHHLEQFGVHAAIE